MGEHVKIADIMRQAIRFAGKIPDVDIARRFTGLQSGQKRAAILSDRRKEAPPSAEGILEVRNHRGSHPSVSYLRGLTKYTQLGDEPHLTKKMFTFIDIMPTRDEACLETLK